MRSKGEKRREEESERGGEGRMTDNGDGNDDAADNDADKDNVDNDVGDAG